MGAFNLEHEQRLFSERGIDHSYKQAYISGQLRALVAERTETGNPFELQVDGAMVQSRGLAHRGDLSNSFKLSVIEAKKTGEEVKAERFKLENDGYEEAKRMFFELPFHSTVLLMSPPPRVHIEGYPGYNLAYFYHVLPGEKPNQRTIKALSVINRFSMDEQAEVLNKVMGEKRVRPSESSILLSPVGVASPKGGTDSFKQVWNIMEDIYKREEREFQLMPFGMAEQYLLQGKELWSDKNKALSMMMDQVAKMIAGGATENDLSDKWNIMLNLADQNLLHKDVSDRFWAPTEEDVLPRTADIFYYYSHMAYTPRKAATMCGDSEGIGKNTNSVSNFIADMFGNPFSHQRQNGTHVMTAEFTLESIMDDDDGLGDRIVECPSCGTDNDRPFLDYIRLCKNTECKDRTAIAKCK